jgi:hypothetical protein
MRLVVMLLGVTTLLQGKKIVVNPVTAGLLFGLKTRPYEIIITVNNKMVMYNSGAFGYLLPNYLAMVTHTF